MSTSSGAKNTVEDEKLECQLPVHRPLPFSTSYASEENSDDPFNAIHAISSKLDYYSSLVNSWHEKCVAAAGTLADLNIRVNKELSKKNKCITLSLKRKLNAEEVATVLSDEIKDFVMLHIRCKKYHTEIKLAFNEGFDKFGVFVETTHPSYNWDYVSPDAVREILDHGRDVSEHKHVKATRKKLTNAD